MSQEIQIPNIRDFPVVEMEETDNHTSDDSDKEGEERTSKIKKLKGNLPMYLKVIVNKFVGIMRPVKIVTQYKRNVMNLRIQLIKLQETRDRVQHDISDVRKNGKEIDESANLWLRDMKKTLQEGNEVLANLKPLSFHLSHKAMTLAECASELITRHSTKILDEYSFNSSFGEIMKAIVDANFQTIGIWGLCGVGTTTLAQRVTREAEEDKLFDVVLMITMPPNGDEERIQQLITDRLGLKFTENDTIEKKAIQLYERIRKEDRILVILDDLNDEVNLENLGLPIGDDHKGCKVLLTSKTWDVLTKKMDAQKVVQVDNLKDEQAWDLFVKMAGDVVAQDSDMKAIFYNIVEELWVGPVLISPFVNALRNKHTSEWNTALSSVESSSQPPHVFPFLAEALMYEQLQKVLPPLWTRDDDLNSMITAIVMFCFNELENGEAKILFLLIGSIGSSHISKYHLFLLAMGFGLLNQVDTLEDGRSRLQDIIDILKGAYLLMEDQEGNVRMHEIICSGVVAILSLPELNTFSHKIGFPTVEEWSNQSFHLILNPFFHLSYLPIRENKPELQVLIIGMDDTMNILEIPRSYFEGMKKLRVLHLRGHFIFPSLLSGLDFLKSLIILNLFECHLRNATIFTQLTNLEVLRLNKSNIQTLTKEFGQLHHLRLLDLENSSICQIIPGVLPMLKNLEELYLGKTNICWGVKDKNNESTNATLNELGGLNRLTTLDITVQDIQACPIDLFFKFHLKFRILIGDSWLWDGKDTYQTLKLQKHGNIHSNKGIKELLKVVKHLALDGTLALKNFLYDLNVDGLPELRYLNIQNNTKIVFILDSTNRVKCHPAFPNLISLVLHGLSNLECIKNGPSVVMGSFHKLNILKVTCCNKIKNLLSFSMIKMMPHLVEIEVSNCKLMEEILLLDEENVNQQESHIELPCLQSLVLCNLPALICFCAKERKASISQQSYEKQILNEINEEHSSFSLFNLKVAFPKLEILYLSALNFDNLWGNQLFGVTSLTQNLTKLTIEKISGLKYLFSIFMLRCLKKLKYLEIMDCPTMEDIYVMHETMEETNSHTNDDSNEKIFFPNLRTLIVDSMENLRNVWHPQLATPYSFCKLRRIKIKNCWRLSPIFPTYIISNLKDLHDLSVDNCNLLEDISYLEELVAKECRVVSEELTFQEQPSKSVFQRMYLTMKKACHCSSINV